MGSRATAEGRRLEADETREANWKRWGPYLAERQWSTVREDYSADGTCWEYFPHDHARSRAYRWGEDGLLGITDRECRLCFAPVLWNGRDPILKERLFGLTGNQGNHGEDVKEEYFYLDSTPTHSYMRALYRYPQREFPYDQLVEENARRSVEQPEYELDDTGVFSDGRYFDVIVEYAKAAPDDLAIRLTVRNRGPEAAVLHLLPTFWFRNTWSWGCRHEGCSMKPRIESSGDDRVSLWHPTLGDFTAIAGTVDGMPSPEWLFTDNETNVTRLFGSERRGGYVKDAFDRYLVHGDKDAVNPERRGTKAAPCYRLEIPAAGSAQVRLRLTNGKDSAVGSDLDRIFETRRQEADQFYETLLPSELTQEDQLISRQAYAGLLWSKQFYHYIIEDWLEGDPETPLPPAGRLRGRNHEWTHLYSRDVLSVPDKWEYPWFAAWDLAFHMLPFARLDPAFAKHQLTLLLREWYLHPNGQLPAYEFALEDVNPPVHAWAVWRVFKISAPRGQRDYTFLERAFQKLLLNFTWWVNRKDLQGSNLFAGGFLGLDNIGIFDRSKPLPTGGVLQQADGTAWMAFYCLTMMDMAMELADNGGGERREAYEDMASKFFEHFIQICDAMNSLGGSGLWHEEDSFYYDEIRVDERDPIALRIRSMVGLLPLIAVSVVDCTKMTRLPGFRKRFEWFLKYRSDLARHISLSEDDCGGCHQWLLAIPSKERLLKVLSYMLDENEFLSPYGIRSLSRYHVDHPYVFEVGGSHFRVGYEPGVGKTLLFGGNSNWRGPVWFPVNYLLIEALERYHRYYGDSFRVEYPTGSGNMCTLQQVADGIAKRLASLFRADGEGRRPSMGRRRDDLHQAMGESMILFHEFFDGDVGAGLGASHQTGWTALVTRCLEEAVAAD